MTPIKKHNQRGFILITVLLTVVLLTALLLQFNYAARAGLYITDKFTNSKQALNCARSGLNLAIGTISRNPDIHTNKTLQNMLTEATFNLEPGQCCITVTDETGKLNINMLKNSNGDLDRVRIDQMLMLLDLLNRQNRDYNTYSYAIVPAIIDWTDADDQVTILPFITGDNIGAESNYYGYIQPAATCKNRPLDTIQELLLVKGFDDQLFSDLKEHITIYGSGKININYADPLVLQSISQHITADLAQMIIDRRNLQPFTSLAELLELPGMGSTMYAAAENYLTTSPENHYYSVTVRGTVNHTDSFITAVVKNNSSTGKVEIILYRESNQTG